MHRLPAVPGLFLCFSHGGSLVAAEEDHNATFNALPVKERLRGGEVARPKRARCAAAPEAVRWMQTLGHRVVYASLHLSRTVSFLPRTRLPRNPNARV